MKFLSILTIGLVLIISMAAFKPASKKAQICFSIKNSPQKKATSIFFLPKEGPVHQTSNAPAHRSIPRSQSNLYCPQTLACTRLFFPTGGQADWL